MVCVACLVLKDDSALDEFVDAAADGAFVHQEHFAGCLAIQQEAVVLSDEGSVSSSVSGAGPSVKHYFRITFPAHLGRATLRPRALLVPDYPTRCFTSSNA